MAEAGFEFRQTTGFVTNISGDSWVNPASGGTSYPITYGNGLTAGYEISSGNVDSRDRNAALNARIAGLHFNSTSTTSNRWRIDLPDGTGDYDIRMAIGDDSATTDDDYVQFLDNGSNLGAVDDANGHPQSQWYDATGVLRTSAALWASSNARARLTYGSTIAQFKFGRGAGAAGICKIACITIEKVAGGGSDGPAAGFRALLGVGR